MCLSPIHGHVDVRKAIEWRENMRMMGFDVVHWHARSPTVGDFVDKYNQVTNSHDTFWLSEPLSPASYGHEKPLKENGVYGDQVSLQTLEHSLCKSRLTFFPLIPYCGFCWQGTVLHEV